MVRQVTAQNLGLYRAVTRRLRRSRIIKAMEESASFFTKDCSAISGKSTLACALSLGLHSRGKLTYILDGDNVQHGLNRDLGFKAEDRAENSRRIAMLFADAGVICTASLISPYRKDRDGCRALLPPGDFIEECKYGSHCGNMKYDGCIVNFTEFIPGERCMKFASDRYSWMCHSNCVRQGTQRVFTDLLELERSKHARDSSQFASHGEVCNQHFLQGLPGLMIHKSHH